MNKEFKNINTIIWDWNGTLLNDIDICLISINKLLKDRNLPTLTLEKYHQAFGFPIIDYYKRIGFNFEEEPFEIPAQQFIDLYTSKIPESNLHTNAQQTLAFFDEKNFKQVILSASETGILEQSVSHFGIDRFFSQLAGLDNHYAQSKVAIGINLLKELKIDISQACLIGDTTHDADVAQNMGIKCILVANGHNSFDTLKEKNTTVLNNLGELPTVFG